MTMDIGGPWVIASADEGVQLNAGTRLGFVGGGYGLAHFDAAVAALRSLLGESLFIASAQEDDWLGEQLHSKNQSLYDETLAAFASEQQLEYAGQIDYGDPKDLRAGIRGHLVRPPKIHVAESICLTAGGGEQTYSLEQFVICADFAAQLDDDQLREILQTQIDFYRRLIGKKLPVKLESEGGLSDEIKAANRQRLEPLLAAWR